MTALGDDEKLPPTGAHPVVGRVAGLWRYPVKSMRGEALQTVDVGWYGLAGDRRWAFIRDGSARSGFPWLTIRECPAMLHYRPWLAYAGRPDASTTMVRTPAGRDLEVVDPELAAELGVGVRVMKQDRGVFDAFPLSVITAQTVASLAELVGCSLGAERFRPNLLVEATGQTPFQEDAWVGRTLRIGSLRIRIDKRDQRCVVVNVHPDTLARDPRVLRTIAQQRSACLGVYGATVEPGRMEIGDPVRLEQ